jgi:hypothetical protein
MGTVDRLSPSLHQALKAKEKRRKMLAALPFADKVRIVVELQRMAWPLLKDRDPRACVWDLAARGNPTGSPTRT